MLSGLRCQSIYERVELAEFPGVYIREVGKSESISESDTLFVKHKRGSKYGVLRISSFKKTNPDGTFSRYDNKENFTFIHIKGGKFQSIADPKTEFFLFEKNKLNWNNLIFVKMID